MKNIKKLLSIMLVLLMVVSISTGVFAAGEGSITINGYHADNTYEIYKMLDLESYNSTTGVYSYKVNSQWKNFFESSDAAAYFAVDSQGYATWIAAEDADTVNAFAKLALAWAETNGISPVKSTTNSSDFSVEGTAIKFSGLYLGYYLIDSTMGALCGLTTTKPDAAINAKNGTPTIDKQVKEDSTENWSDNNTAEIGQTVEFRTTIEVHAGAQNYVLHDKMSEGLTFDEVSYIEHVVPGVGTHTVPNTKYTVNAPGTTCEYGCTFEVKFSQEFCDELETNDKVIVYYTAVLNEKAEIGGADENEAWLDYGEDHESNHDSTETFTYAFDLVKTNSENKLIDGAAFRIYDALTGGNEVAFVMIDDTHYRRALPSETGVDIVVNDGKVRVEGLDNGTYYLEEVVTPSGYNQLSARQKFIISDSNLDATITDGTVSVGSGVQVVNKSGSILPETGGMGTAMFIGFGALVVLATGVLLVTKKRMGMIED